MSTATLPLEMIKSANLMEQLMEYLGTEDGKRMLAGAGIGGGLGALTGGMTGGWGGGLIGLLTGGALGGVAGHNWQRLMGAGEQKPAAPAPAPLKTRSTLQREGQLERQRALDASFSEQLKASQIPAPLGGDNVASTMFPGYPDLLARRNLTKPAQRPALVPMGSNWSMPQRPAALEPHTGTMPASFRSMWQGEQRNPVQPF